MNAIELLIKAKTIIGQWICWTVGNNRTRARQRTAIVKVMGVAPGTNGSFALLVIHPDDCRLEVINIFHNHRNWDHPLFVPTTREVKRLLANSLKRARR